MNNIPDTPAYTYKAVPQGIAPLSGQPSGHFAGHIRNKERIEYIKIYQ